MKRIVTLVLALALILCVAPKSEAATLSSSQKAKIKKIYQVVGAEKNYKKYHVLPSVCMAFAMVESGIGQACRPNNLWGLNGGRNSYGSLESGIKAYMQCINKSYYTRYGATKTKSWYQQTSRIIRGGYCQPAGAYVSKVCSIMRNYHFDKYDKKMFKKIKKARKQHRLARIQKQKEREKKLKEIEQRRQARRIFAMITSMRNLTYNSIGLQPIPIVSTLNGTNGTIEDINE